MRLPCCRYCFPFALARRWSLSDLALSLCSVWLLGSVLACAGSDPVGPERCATRPGGKWTFLGLEGKRVSAIAETPWGLYAGTRDNGVFRLNADDGRWEALGLDHQMVSEILYVPSTPPRLLVAMAPRSDGLSMDDTEAAVYTSDDGGLTWQPWDGGLDARAGERGNDAWAFSLAIDPGNPERLYMGRSYSVLRSDDAGLSWHYVLGDEDAGGQGVNAIVISPTRDGRIWAGGATLFFAAIVHRSHDWGATWEHWLMPGGDATIYSLLVDPANPNRLWAGAGGVLRSDDGGASWEGVLVPRHPAYVPGLQLVGADLYAITDENTSTVWHEPHDVLGLYRSCDGGEHWDTLATPSGARGARGTATDSLGRLLIGTLSGVWRLEP